jgi:hypothetical protein
MSHNVGTVQTVSPAFTIGPDTGTAPSGPNTWSASFASTPAPTGTKFLILHFTGVSLPASNRLEVDLGYDTDVFTSADGSDFWTRPVNVYRLAGGLVPIRYITNGAASGIVTLGQYGRGERMPGIQDPSALSNCDPFLKDPTYAEPLYDPYWYCTDPPNWENAACATGDIRSSVAPSVGMILHVDTELAPYNLSTCTVTLIAPDQAICAGHCMPQLSLVASASVIFGYQTNCDGTRPASYSPQVCKVVRTIKQRYADGTQFDYWIVQLKVPSGGLGIAPIQLRHDLPLPGEQVFGIHHPNGAVKKLSIPHPGFDAVVTSDPNAVTVPTNFSVSGGSSGSGLFDAAGRIVGVLSNGSPCGSSPVLLRYFPTASILPDLSTPPPPISRDVMVVFDRSGSMSAQGASGRSKIEEARDAASLFVQLVRTGAGNRLGLVSFSTVASSPVDFALHNVTPASQATLVGPAPYIGGVVGGLAPGGVTTIGGGLDAARLQFPGPGANPRSILLLTDGLQNTPPMIADVEPALSGIDVNVIGYGTPANLDGALLSALAAAHGGQYARGDTNLQLEKFFAQAFGNIFEAGLLMDPEFTLAPNQRAATPIPFSVCEEERLTVVLGWDVPGEVLLMDAKTPLGHTITGSTAGVQQQTGETWSFLRIPLPQGGERDGTWHVEVFRAPSRGEVAPAAPELRCFVSVVASGGAVLRRKPDLVSYYTGDAYNPRIQLQYATGGLPPNAKLQVIVSRPDASLGSILSQAKLGPPATIGGDAIPARQATLAALEAAQGKPLISLTQRAFDLDDSPANNDGAFEAGGNFGIVLPDLLTVDGDYTFRVLATYGEGCTASRERVWSLHVAVGIDPSQTTTGITVTGTSPGGGSQGAITVTPRDKYGNNLGPGLAGSVTFTGSPGVTLTGVVGDNGDGSYTVPVILAPGANGGIVVGQPGRPPVVILAPPASEPTHHGDGDRDRSESTGKVEGIIYDRFGDFDGFLLLTEHGHERSFRSREHAVQELVHRAWVARTVITVIVHRHDPHCPVSIILRRAAQSFRD